MTQRKQRTLTGLDAYCTIPSVCLSEHNLIPHQSVSGMWAGTIPVRRLQAGSAAAGQKEALERVGLGNQLGKKPNQMSGGQMQQVAIAKGDCKQPGISFSQTNPPARWIRDERQVMEILQRRFPAIGWSLWLRITPILPRVFYPHHSDAGRNGYE